MNSKNTTKKVLLIEDNPTIVELIKYVVNLQGTYQIIIVQDDAQEPGSIFIEQPDCIIIDVKEPQMDGYQLVHRLRDDARTANTPLIVLRAVAREKDPLATLLSDTDEYLTKPFKPSALNAAIERVLHRMG